MPTARSVEKSPAENGLPASQAANGTKSSVSSRPAFGKLNRIGIRMSAAESLSGFSRPRCSRRAFERSTRMGSTMNALLATNAVSSASRETPTTSR